MDERTGKRRGNKVKAVELDQEFIVLAIPASTLEIKITARIWNDGKVQTVERTMPNKEVRAAIREAEIGYVPSDTAFSLTEYGKSRLEELLGKCLDDTENYNVD